MRTKCIAGGGRKQAKTVTPLMTQQIIEPSTGYQGLSKVTVLATPYEEKQNTYGTTVIIGAFTGEVTIDPEPDPVPVNPSPSGDYIEEYSDDVIVYEYTVHRQKFFMPVPGLPTPTSYDDDNTAYDNNTVILHYHARSYGDVFDFPDYSTNITDPHTTFVGWTCEESNNSHNLIHPDDPVPEGIFEFTFNPRWLIELPSLYDVVRHTPRWSLVVDDEGRESEIGTQTLNIAQPVIVNYGGREFYKSDLPLTYTASDLRDQQIIHATIEGWYTEEVGGTKLSVGDEITLPESTSNGIYSVDIYAHLIPESHNVSFNCPGYTFNSLGMLYGSHFALPTVDDSIEGRQSAHDTVKWYSDSNHKMEVTNANYVGLTQDITLYGEIVQEYKYNVEYTPYKHPQSNVHMASSKQSTTLDHPATTWGDIFDFPDYSSELPAADQSRYTFDGWTYQQSLIQPEDPLPENTFTVYLSPKWSTTLMGYYKIERDKNEPSKVLDSNGREAEIGDYVQMSFSMSTSTSYDRGTALYAGDVITYQASDLPNLSNDHATFDGWYTEKTGGTKIEVGDTAVLPEPQQSNGDTYYEIKIYAHWILDTHQVTFSGPGSHQFNPRTVTYGKNFNLPTIDDCIEEECEVETGNLEWYDDDSYTKRVTNSHYVGLTQDITLYGKIAPFDTFDD